MTPAPAIMWFRRDLRLSDNPALRAAADSGAVVAIFVLDPALVRPAGPPRLAFLYRTLRTLDAQLRERGGALTVITGNPIDVITTLATDTRASSVHIAADYGPYGSARDRDVERALHQHDIPLVRTGSPYAVAPGRIRNGSGDPYRVFTPFFQAWRRHGWRPPVPPPPATTRWMATDGEPLPEDLLGVPTLPAAGEPAAQQTWQAFRSHALARYPANRNRPAAQGTSRLSAHLKFGTIHPRTLLAGVGPGDEAFARQIAWREFYAAVLHFWPDSARRYFQPAMAGLTHNTGRVADTQFAAWCSGRTGYPLVDAGMRQLAATGWMHNRVRMVTASFLVKDLHIEWTRGARFFMHHLVDGDLANNQHGWQWVAGTGTDAAPYHRVLNPIIQSRRFDPDGGYLRRWIPEIAGLPDSEIHTPWQRPGGPPHGYPAPIVDHATERQYTLDDYHSARQHTV